jgi:hypothetical protein
MHNAFFLIAFIKCAHKQKIEKLKKQDSQKSVKAAYPWGRLTLVLINDII